MKSPRQGRVTPSDIVGWKTYAVGVAAIAIGFVALAYGHWADGAKGVLGGLALIALRDAIAKVLRAVEANRRAFADMRATVEAEIERAGKGVRS